MPMKFHLLPDGQPFVWRGINFVKNGPVTASGPDGKQQMIPRSALVKPELEGRPETRADANSTERRLAHARNQWQSRLDDRLKLLAGQLTPEQIEILKADIRRLADLYFKESGLSAPQDQDPAR